jgi:hypothetical protein
MSSRRLAVLGNNRGAAAVVSQLAANTAARFRRDWLLADPKLERSARLAELVRHRFPGVHPVARQADALSVVRDTQDLDALLLTMDTVEDTHAVVRSARDGQATTYQLVGQGPGGITGTRIGLIGTVQPGNTETARQANLFFEGLGRVTRAASSRELTSNPLTGMVLSQIRHALAHRTVAHLDQLEREPWDLTGGPLSIFVGDRLLPLVPAVAEPDDNYRRRVERARQAFDSLPEQHWRTYEPSLQAVAGVLTEDSARIELMRVRMTPDGQRIVTGVTVFSDPVESVRQEPARFTD